MNARTAGKLVFLSSFALLAPALMRAQDARPNVSTQQVLPPDGAPNPRRAQLEAQLRERTGQMVKRRLALSDDQMSKLQSANRSFEKQRMDLMLRERETRQALRAEMQAGDGANQAKVGQLLDQSIQIQRQRLDLLQTEQRELGKFLTPVQRARYFGIQTELRKRAQQVRAQQMDGQQMGGGQPPLRRMGNMRRPLAGQPKR
jgi:protein CpxP